MGHMNEKLRLATTGGFTLHLGRTAIARLVLLDHELRHMAHILPPSHEPATWRNDMVGQRVLERTGLVEHIAPPGRKSTDEQGRWYPVRTLWRVTSAGRLVIALLKESGVYEDYANQLPPCAEWRSDTDLGQLWLDTGRGKRWAQKHLTEVEEAA